MAKKDIRQIELMINGEDHSVIVKSSATLMEVLREKLDLTGTKNGCDSGECGACTVLLDGKVVYACMMLAIDACGKEVTTIEGVAKPQKIGQMEHTWPPGQNKVSYEGITGGDLDIIQEKMHEHSSYQCGFCVPGRVLVAKAMFQEYPLDQITPELVKHELAGHLCRCGYGTAVEAIVDAAQTLASKEVK